MQRCVLGCLVLLSILSGCKESRVWWNILPEGDSTVIGVCLEAVDNFTVRQVEKKRCRKTKFPEGTARLLGTEFFGCTPKSGYVWEDCNPEAITFMKSEGKIRPKAK